MTPEDLQRRLLISGINCRVKKDEVVIEVCPYCGNDRWNMEVNVVRGVAKCWSCNSPQPGRADVVVKLLTGEAVRIDVQGGRHKPVRDEVAAPISEFKPVDAVDSAARYLERRGVDSDVARRYGLGYCDVSGHLLEGRITIPARDFWSDELLGHVGRSYTNKRPKYLSTLPPRAPITGWRVPGRAPCVVVEGHMDGIAAHRAGYSAAVLSSTAGPGFVTWAARVDPRIMIVVMLDGSAAQQARSLYWELCGLRGPERAAWIALREDQDPASLGPLGVREEVSRLIEGRSAHFVTQREEQP